MSCIQLHLPIYGRGHPARTIGADRRRFLGETRAGAVAHHSRSPDHSSQNGGILTDRVTRMKIQWLHSPNVVVRLTRVTGKTLPAIHPSFSRIRESADRAVRPRPWRSEERRVGK